LAPFLVTFIFVKPLPVVLVEIAVVFAWLTAKDIKYFKFQDMLKGSIIIKRCISSLIPATCGINYHLVWSPARTRVVNGCWV